MCNTVKTRTAKSVNLVLLRLLVVFFLVSVTIIGIIGPAAELGVVVLLGCSCALLDLRGKLHIFEGERAFARAGRKLRSYESVEELHRSI
jgi:hypothetical protein